METIKSILEVAKEKGFTGEIDVEPTTELCIKYLKMPLSSGELQLKYHLLQRKPNDPIVCNVWLQFISNHILYNRPLAFLYNGHVNENLGPEVFTDLIKNIDMIIGHLYCGSDDEDVAIEKWINNSTFEVLEG